MSADKAAKGKVHKNHVQFGDDVKEPRERPAALSPAPRPSEVTIPPPAANFVIKDEVELLRSGTLNKHGDRLKTQAASGTKT
ncbi:unnamed protein product [Nippostrongylus brasiliensis]|uniref:Uncharacterized protein n=1 Tax=Nippostrongylus brasiliensis TaxID=27835 RepID=A0A0N4XDF7_NIPBR|nr:hypothetical protein Q1695_012634 [Nippostrongylus brasiliensis]VDL63283.1 unnamed protein product [Nippostrongylus brasiliensis]VDL65099.1 unnamed protein product [Nippostrongylus brasiliensis]